VGETLNKSFMAVSLLIVVILLVPLVAASLPAPTSSLPHLIYGWPYYKVVVTPNNFWYEFQVPAEYTGWHSINFVGEHVVVILPTRGN